VSGFFDDDPPAQQRAAVPPRGPSGRARALIGTAVVLVVTFFVISVFTNVWTDRLWFRNLGYGEVFSKVLGTRVLLFVVFGLVMAVFVAANIIVAYRYRPLFRPTSQEQASLDRYRNVVDPLRRWLLIGVAVVLGLFAGASGAGQWRQFLLWRHQQPFNKTDPYFHRDIGFYVFELPWLHHLVNFSMAVVVLGLIAAAVVHYLFGGIRLQVQRDKVSGAAQVQLSVLLGLFVLFKAVDYWLDRFDLTTNSGGLFTGMSYTDYHAELPSKNILFFIALICAVLLIANVFRRTWLLPSVGVALLALSAILLGVLWPGIVQQFQVKPSEPDSEGPYIRRNIEATRTAYGIADTKVTEYRANVDISPEQVRADAKSIAQVRLLDPSLVNDTFENLQQVRGYYSVPPVLDVDQYPVNGEERDMVLAVRELDQAGLRPEQRNWNNLHTVYTHGFGVIAAFGNQRNAAGEPVRNDGEPEWAEKDIPPQGVLTDLTSNGYQPRIYFGENSPSYSIVGREPGGPSVELDTPERAGGGSTPSNNTYGGKGGVEVGNLFNKVLYAIKFSEPNIVLSSRVNGNSRILYERHPRERVQKVAPWLTVDGDPYPAVVNGRVKWILDGYTTSDHYPNSEKRSLREMTSDALSPQTSYATLPTDDINYMRNSVKAVVDAYDGSVTLYQWADDPILKAWDDTFPGIIQDKSTIPPALRAHMRYPEDLFKVQRDILAEYHVKDPQTFYSGNDRWKVPEDPAVKTQSQPPYRLAVSLPGSGPDPVYSLTSVFVPTSRQNLAAFISADSEAATKDYGTIRILRLPGKTQVQGPGQIANTFASDEGIQNALLPYRNNSKVLYGNLLTLPVGNGLLYVQPVYTLRESGAGSYPVLRYVLASFGKEAGYGTTLAGALEDVLGLSPGGTGQFGGTGQPPPATGPNVTPGASSDVAALLERAEAKFTEAEKALRSGDFAGYAKAEAEARKLVQQALELAGRPTATPSGSPSGSPSGEPSGGPSASSKPSGSSSPKG
jgi:uncharacterized membrane protein (UPF0182 family)